MADNLPPIPPGPRVVGYARVSTDDQDMSLQRQALIKYGVDPRLIYEEHASGGRMNRPTLGFMLSMCRDGDTIVVWKLDRLGRTLTGVIEVVERMTQEGIELVSLTETIDTKSAMGRAFFQIALVFAELERALISERTTAGIAAAKADGRMPHRSHSILDVPARRDLLKQWIETGRVDDLTGREAIRLMNEIEGPEITAPETYLKLKRDGFKKLGE